MKHLTIILSLLLSVQMAFAQDSLQTQVPMPLSESAYATLITCEPSNEIYTSFSHTGLRICDTVSGIDVVYNYGTFDFSTPHFVWKFATRTLDYCLSKSTYLSFIMEYDFWRRAVWEQRLKLTHQEVCNLYTMLEWNYLPENRWYRYDFFRDNCATRIRDMITNCLDHRTLNYPKDDHTGKTYRQIVYTTNQTYRLWWRLIIDLALGMRCDKDCSTFECAFLPLEMKTQFDTLTISGTNETLAEPPHLTLQDHRPPLHKSFSPTLAFWLLFIVVAALTFLAWWKKWQLKVLDIILFSVNFIGSLILIFLWFFSAHYCTKWNLNLLWISPFFLYFAIRLYKSNTYVVLFQMLLLVLAMIVAVFGWPQQFNSAVLPLILIYFVRLLDKLKLHNIIKRK